MEPAARSKAAAAPTPVACFRPNRSPAFARSGLTSVPGLPAFRAYQRSGLTSVPGLPAFGNTNVLATAASKSPSCAESNPVTFGRCGGFAKAVRLVEHAPGE